MDNADDNFFLVLTLCGSWIIYPTVEVFRGLSLFHRASGVPENREADTMMMACGVLCGVGVACITYPWIMLCLLPTYHSRILAGCLGLLFLPVSLAAMITRHVVQVRFKDLILSVCLTPDPSSSPSSSPSSYRYPLSASQSTLTSSLPTASSWCTTKWRSGRSLTIFFIFFACFTGALITLMSLSFLRDEGNLVRTEKRVCFGLVTPRKRSATRKGRGRGWWWWGRKGKEEERRMEVCPPAYPDPAGKP